MFSLKNSLTRSMERFKLTNLEQNHGYIIQLTLKVNKEIISYQTLQLFKSHHCFKPILNHVNQLPNAMSQNSTTDQHIEDNNIFLS